MLFRSPTTFASTLQPDIHVIGDAAITGALPKAAFAANAEGKACATAVALLLRGGTPSAPTLANTCYALAAPDYGFSIKGVFRPEQGQFVEVEGAGQTSPLQASAAARTREAHLADGWFKTITHETFG